MSASIDDELIDPFRSVDSSDIDHKWDTRPDHWLSRIYEKEFNSFPIWIRNSVRYVILMLALTFALDLGTRYARSVLCQWGLEKFCETVYDVRE